MHYLWLTLCDPDPQTNGQFLYSGGLVRAAAAAGAQITALGLARQAGLSRQEPNIDWEFGEDRPLPPALRAVSRFPTAALRTCVPQLQRALLSHLKDTRWDAIVLDSINVGWTLPHVLAYRRRFPTTTIVYVAQNEETKAAQATARAATGLRRVVRLADVWKTRWLERQLVRSADITCADSPEDCRLFAKLAPSKPVFFVPPGYRGRRLASRRIDSRVPRRAVVVGSFDWAPKRTALEAFARSAAPLFARSAVSLQIVGRTDPGYASGLRRQFPWIDMVGTVPDVTPYLADARIALVPDVLGGFKLKTLDYVFNRTPIFAIEGSVPGTPLQDRTGLRLFKSHGELARGVVDAIDDTESLNAQQETAFDLCTDRYDWAVIGRALVDRISGPSRSMLPTLNR